eukprot:1503967-Rhodomonas_salina.1
MQYTPPLEDALTSPRPDPDREPEETDVIFGWKISTVFCTAVLLIFPIPVTYCVFFVPSDEAALIVDGSPVPRTGFFVMMVGAAPIASREGDVVG